MLINRELTKGKTKYGISITVPDTPHIIKADQVGPFDF